MFYQRSKKGHISKLKPNLSMHNEKFVYLTMNKVVALVYTVNAIEQFYEDNNFKKTKKNSFLV